MPALGWSRELRRVQLSRRPHERLEGVLVELIALVQVDGAPRAGVEARVEEAGWVVERRSLGEGQLHLVLVGLAGEDHPVAGPDRHSVGIRRLAPLVLFLDPGDGLLDEAADPGNHLAAPVVGLGGHGSDSITACTPHSREARGGLYSRALRSGSKFAVDQTWPPAI